MNPIHDKNAQESRDRNTGVGKHIPIHFFFLKKRDAFTYRRENEAPSTKRATATRRDPCLPGVPGPLSPRCPCTQGTKQRSAVRLSLQPRLLPPRTPVPELRDTYIPSHLEAFCLPFLLPRTPYHPLAPELSLQHSKHRRH